MCSGPKRDYFGCAEGFVKSKRLIERLYYITRNKPITTVSQTDRSVRATNVLKNSTPPISLPRVQDFSEKEPIYSGQGLT